MSSRVVALTDNNPTYLDTHAWVLFKLGRTDEAKKVLQKAVALDGQKSHCADGYGDILHELGEQFMAEISEGRGRRAEPGGTRPRKRAARKAMKE